MSCNTTVRRHRCEPVDECSPSDDFLVRLDATESERSFDSAKLWDNDEDTPSATSAAGTRRIVASPAKELVERSPSLIQRSFTDSCTESTSATGTPALLHATPQQLATSPCKTSAVFAVKEHTVCNSFAATTDEEPLYLQPNSTALHAHNATPLRAKGSIGMPTVPVARTSFGSESSRHTPQFNSVTTSSRGPQLQSETHTLPQCDKTPPVIKKDIIPDCPTKVYIESIGRLLHRTDEEMVPIIKRLVCDNWLETLQDIKNLSLADWECLGLPRQLLRCTLHHLPNAESIIRGCIAPNEGNEKKLHINNTLEATVADIAAAYVRSTASSANAGSSTFLSASPQSVPGTRQHNELVQFIVHACVANNLSSDDTLKTVRCIHDEHWFDSLDQLRALTTPQWMNLGLDASIVDMLRQALSVGDDDYLERMIVRAGSALGRSKEQLQQALNKLRVNNKHTPDALSAMTQKEWLELKLPLRLQEEIIRQVQETQQCHQLNKNHLPSNGHPGSLLWDSQIDRADSGPLGDPRIVSTKEERDARLVTVERLLVKAGKKEKKSPTDMQPIVQKVTNEHWVDTIRALRAMPQAEWTEIGIPKRIAEALDCCMMDPKVLELNTVQFTPPEPELFPCDVISAVWRLESEVPVEHLPDTIRSLLKLTETILCNPFEESRRLVRKANPNFQARAGKYKSALLFLESVGFEDFGPVYVLFVAYVSRLTEAHAALAQLAHVLRERLKKTKSSKIALFSSLRYG